MKGLFVRAKNSVKRNLQDLKEVLADRKAERTKKHYHYEHKHEELLLPTKKENTRNARQRALAKHRKQISRDSRKANRGQGKGQKVQGRGH